MLRRALGGLAGAVTAGLGAVILGEYPFSGLVILGAGVLFGLFVAEAIVGIGRWRGPVAATLAACLAGGGLVWAAWISEGHQLGHLPAGGWAAVGLGVLAAGLRVWRPAAAIDSPTRTAPPP